MKLRQVDTLLDSCPSLLQHYPRLQCFAGVYPAWHFTLLHTGPACTLPILTEFSAPIPAWWSLVKGQPCTPRTCAGSGSVATAHMEPLYRSGQQEVHQHYWPEERGVAARLCDLELGDPRSNPQGAGADRPYLLLSTREKDTNGTLRRETCEDRHTRPPRSDAIPEV